LAHFQAVPCNPGGLCPIELSKVPDVIFDMCVDKLSSYGDTFELVSCEKQVVSGTMWYCEYESKYTQNDEMVFTCQILENLISNNKSRNIFEEKALKNNCKSGEICPIEITPEVTNLALWSISQINSNKIMEELFLGEIIIAEEEIVGGINYYLTLDTTRGNCFEVYQVKIFGDLNDKLKLVSYSNLYRDSNCDPTS